jgi:hypothetical protein
MYVWELVSYRLRVDGWDVWHTTRQDSIGPIYTVHIRRPELTCDVSGPTLTEAYASAAKRAREHLGSAPQLSGPHFSRISLGIMA